MADIRAALGRLWRSLTRPVRYFVLCFVEGDREWGDYRLIALWVLILALAVVGRFLEHIDPRVMLNSVYFVNRVPVVGWLTSLFPPEPLSFFYGFFTRATLRYWVPSLFGAALAFTTGALYLQDIFELKRFWREAVVYLYGSLFAQAYPVITVREGQIVEEPGELNWLDLIGGPGYVDVKLGNAILCERIVGPSSVYGAGRHLLRRFETVREVVSLEEQHRKVDEVPAVTKDGIPVTIRDLEVTFRIRTGPQPRTPENPYPFLPGAIRQIAYGRTVSEKGVSDWQSGVVGAVRGRITNFVATQRLDELTGPIRNPEAFADPAPRADDPRKVIHELFEKSDVRKQFAEMGVELLLVSIGHLDSPPEVDAQRLINWRTRWEGRNSLTRAYAEAQDIEATMRARAQAQADTLQAITRALQAATAQTPPTTGRLHDLLILHMAQILESMTAGPGRVDKTTAQLEGGLSAPLDLQS